ncbi:hypothetical protein SXCC_00104 [Gluconacetobacter sp. SXCC-1]|nr:hypothetical protein SXCC_00104 [Gluconacetobacter sp. SXCC-1]
MTTFASIRIGQCFIQVSTKNFEIYSPRKRFDSITKPAQPNKPIFNIKETRLLHHLSFQSTPKKWNHTEQFRANEFFESATFRSGSKKYYAFPSRWDFFNISVSINSENFLVPDFAISLPISASFSFIHGFSLNKEKHIA